MTEKETLREELKAMVDKGHRCLESAQRDLNASNFDFASSRAYYATFHFLQAALLTRGLSYSKHSGVASGFSEQFIKTGVFPKDFGAWIQRLRKDREIGDYGYAVRVSKEEVEEDISLAQKIVHAVESFLQPYISQ